MRHIVAYAIAAFVVIDAAAQTQPGDYVFTTFAGRAGTSGSTDAVGTNARFNRPFGVAVGPAGEVYVSDATNHIVRKITPDGTVTTLAGQPGVVGIADGIGSAAKFGGDTT